MSISSLLCLERIYLEIEHGTDGGVARRRGNRASRHVTFFGAYPYARAGLLVTFFGAYLYARADMLVP